MTALTELSEEERLFFQTVLDFARERVAPKVGTFLLGMGVGVGLGILFAPSSGEEIRNTISEQAGNIRDRVSEQATNLKEKVRETVRRESGEGSQGRMPRPA